MIASLQKNTLKGHALFADTYLPSQGDIKRAWTHKPDSCRPCLFHGSFERVTCAAVSSCWSSTSECEDVLKRNGPNWRDVIVSCVDR